MTTSEVRMRAELTGTHQRGHVGPRSGAPESFGTGPRNPQPVSTAELDAMRRPVSAPPAGGTRRSARARLRRVAALSYAAEAVIVFAAALLVADVVLALGSTALIMIAVVTISRSRQRLTISALDDMPRLLVVVATSVLVAVLALAHHTSVGRVALLIAVSFAALVVARTLTYAVARRVRQRPNFQRRTVVIGGGTVGTMLVESMVDQPEYGLHPVAVLEDAPREESLNLDIPVRPLANTLRDFIQAHDIATVVVAFSSLREPELLALLRTCDHARCDVYVVPRLFEYLSMTGDMDRIHAIPLMRVRRDVHRSLQWRLKRFLSAFVAGLGLAAASPLLAIIALAVWLDDRSAPVLFRQTRVSMDGAEFTMLKFRSMRPANDLESQTKWNIAQDDRLGKLGRFLRKTSLDELPQLWNVVRGDMRLVGPRPERPHFVKKFGTEIPGYDARHRIPAGLTGWAAIHGLRGDTSLSDRTLYDNYYIENWSLWLDIKIVLRTVLAVLRRTGG